MFKNGKIKLRKGRVNMKKCIAAVLLAATLCTCLLLPGCASKKQGIVATGEYNGMKITLPYNPEV